MVLAGQSKSVNMASFNVSRDQPVVILLTVMVLCCQQTARDSGQRLTKTDTLAVLQTVLDDKPLDTLIKKVFTTERLKLIAGRVVHAGYELTYKGKAVPILLQDSTLTEPHYTRPLRFNVRIQTFKVRKDTVHIFMMFGATNQTVDFWLVNKPLWRVVARSFGRV